MMQALQPKSIESHTLITQEDLLSDTFGVVKHVLNKGGVSASIMILRRASRQEGILDA